MEENNMDNMDNRSALREYKNWFLSTQEGWSAHAPTEGDLLLTRRIRASKKEGFVCMTNDRLHVNINVYSTWVQNIGRFHRTAEFEIVGEYAESRWSSFKLYGIPWNEAFENRASYIKNLLASWDALCSLTRTSTEEKQ